MVCVWLNCRNLRADASRTMVLCSSSWLMKCLVVIRNLDYVLRKLTFILPMPFMVYWKSQTVFTKPFVRSHEVVFMCVFVKNPSVGKFWCWFIYLLAWSGMLWISLHIHLHHSFLRSNRTSYWLYNPKIPPKHVMPARARYRKTRPQTMINWALSVSQTQNQ